MRHADRKQIMTIIDFFHIGGYAFAIPSIVVEFDRKCSWNGDAIFKDPRDFQRILVPIATRLISFASRWRSQMRGPHMVVDPIMGRRQSGIAARIEDIPQRYSQ